MARISQLARGQPARGQPARGQSARGQPARAGRLMQGLQLRTTITSSSEL